MSGFFMTSATSVARESLSSVKKGSTAWVATYCPRAMPRRVISAVRASRSWRSVNQVSVTIVKVRNSMTQAENSTLTLRPFFPLADGVMPTSVEIEARRSGRAPRFRAR